MSAAFTSTPNLLSDLLDRAAAHRPDAEALTDGTDRLTWAEYRDAAARLAGALASAGVEPGDRVGVLMPKSVRSFVTVHAIQRAGAIVVPVDWFAPEAHIATVLTEAGVHTLVSTVAGRKRASLSPLGLTIIDPSDVDAEPLTAHPANPDDPAYIIFTSGSTGRPKGIVHTHASAVAYAERAATTYGLTADDRLANIAPLHFDQSTFELYAGPLAGSAAIVVPDGVVRFPASLAGLLDAERATVLYTVPYVIEQLVERGDVAAGDLHSLRWVKYGGEAFAPARLRAAMDALPAARFSNVYGPAEVNQCTVRHVDAPPAGDGPVAIGEPWAGVETLVVDDDGAVIDDDGAGELWVTGPTTMREYWDRPDLTERSLVHRDDGTGPWYRTGDLVRRSDDGLVFLGRADNQVKLRGNRIELEAVDAAIRSFDGVTGCAAFLDRTADEPRLVAMISPEFDDDEKRSLLAHLRAHLPPYAIPTEVRTVGNLPRTPTGKADRLATATAFAALPGADPTSR